MIGFERGSEWRRWDLHVHTPGTQKNDQYEGNTIQEKWENFYQTIDEYIGDGTNPMRNIAVIGITDYLSVDNCKKVIRDESLPHTVKLVLPNVELRMMPMAKQAPINIHCIFNPQILNELESRFFSKLIFSYSGNNYSASHEDLRRLGRAFRDPSLTDEEAYSIGLEQFVITQEALDNVFKNDVGLRNDTIIVVSNNSVDGVSGTVQHKGYSTETGSQMDATRRSIYRMADLVFSSSPSDIAYFLGESDSDDPEIIMRNYGSLKGCIHGSDAHSNNKVFEPDSQRYCWIKSDPTFNGLKQIIYEPKARIRISALKPEEKPNYQVIDSVKFDNNDFSQESILFNDKLTCIIGGKSTGKSLLLHNMALAIDSSQVTQKLEITKSGSRIIPEIEVKWADGTISSPGTIEEKHKIVYVPQTYLNRLTDENEEQTEIDEIIHDIVMINPDAAEAFRTMKDALGTNKQELDKKIYDCVQRYSEYVEKKEKIAEIGTREGIQKEIDKLKGEKDKLAKETSITQEEINQYDSSSSTLTMLNRSLSNIDKEIDVLDNLHDLFRPVDIPDGFSDEVRNILSEKIMEITDFANSKWDQAKQSIKENLLEKKNNIISEQTKNKDIVDKIAPIIAENEAVKELSLQISKEEENLQKYNEIEQQLENRRQQYNQSVLEIIQAFGNFQKIHEQYAEEINHNDALSSDGLIFSVTTPFRSEAFCEMLSGTYDKRLLKNQRDWLDIDTIDSKNFITDANLKNIIEKTLCEELRTIKGKTIESALREIFADWYNSTYQVEMDGDSIGHMSPGKKALVLLKLLVNLAESKCPILIDQPEDDLDNRSIFDELIPFLRRKKIDRQIIIVTHNANVVLGGDAEEVIVANQKGDNSPNKKYKFEYRTGAIEDDMPISAHTLDVLSSQGIQQHICDILEGGEKAFDLRKNKYRI